MSPGEWPSFVLGWGRARGERCFGPQTLPRGVALSLLCLPCLLRVGCLFPAPQRSICLTVLFQDVASVIYSLGPERRIPAAWGCSCSDECPTSAAPAPPPHPASPAEPPHQLPRTGRGLVPLQHSTRPGGRARQSGCWSSSRTTLWSRAGLMTPPIITGCSPCSASI